MSTTELNTLIDRGMMATIAHRYERDVRISLKIAAGSSRVMYALSIPEYIEAWLQAPESADVRFVFNLVARETFRFDLYRAKGLQASVISSCRVVGTNRVEYIWKARSSVGTTESLVVMQLRPASEGCILSLKHSGFKDKVESAWCSGMWHQSLERLGRLMSKNWKKNL